METLRTVALPSLVRLAHTPSITVRPCRSNIWFLEEKVELRAGVWTGWVLLLVLERHFRRDIQRPVISVPDMKLNHLLEVKGDVRDTNVCSDTNTGWVLTPLLNRFLSGTQQ